MKLRHFIFPILSLFLINPGNIVAEPFPFPHPEDLEPYWGDPERAPEQQARFRDSHPMTPFTISWPINEGNPFADWGHFRLSRQMLNGRPSQALRVSVSTERDELRRLADLFENKAWQGGSDLRISVLSPPEGVNPPEGGWPVVFTFPGAGGVGREQIRNDRLSGTLLWATEYYRQNMPGYVVSFHPARRPFSYLGDGQMGLNLSPIWDLYLDVVDHFSAKDGVNPDRIYAMGHSMGGTSVWYLMRDRPGLLAAAVPNAGQPLAEAEDYEKTREVPILMIQGHDDTWVGSSSYLWAYQQLMAMEHPRVRFWEIQDIGHSGGSMNLTVVHQWMYQQQRGTEALPAPPYQENRARVWTALDGRTLSGMFYQFTEAGVELILPDERQVQVPLDRFSEKDQEYVFARTGFRQWRNTEGVAVVARLIEREAANIQIETVEGREFMIPWETLSEQDRRFLESLEPENAD